MDMNNNPSVSDANKGSQTTNDGRQKRRSLFQKYQDDHNISTTHNRLPVSTDFDKIDSWGLLHDIDDDRSNSFDANTSHFFGSYIDHRPSIAMMKALNCSSNPKLMKRPSTAPKRSSLSNVDKLKSSKSTISDNKDSNLRKCTSFSSVSPKDSKIWDHIKDYGSISKSQNCPNVDVVIDVDALMEHVKTNRDKDLNIESESIESDYNSQPSSRRSSNSSSLDDVCLPIDEVTDDNKIWPDISVLNEFSKEEIEKLKKEAIQDAENFHFHYEEDEESIISGNGIAFSKPIITNIDVPELGNTRINETEQFKKGRLRPKRISPWHLRKRKSHLSDFSQGFKSKNNRKSNEIEEDFFVGHNIQYPPHIISNNPEVFRFTYFREDLDSTIHSPTISGLLQPGQKFDELFTGSVYSQPISTPGDTKSSTPLQHQQLQSQILQNFNHIRHSNNFPGLVSDFNNIIPFWLDVLNPTEEEMKVLSKTFGIHPLTTEDIFLGEVREKVELFKDYYLVCFRSFDIVAERSIRKKKQGKQQQDNNNSSIGNIYRDDRDGNIKDNWWSKLFRNRRRSSTNKTFSSTNSSIERRIRREKEENEKYKKKSGDRKKPRAGELEPLNVYIIVFRTGVLTFHFAPTPHPINVRRRARLLKDYLNVTADWIAYALIDDITDAFGPMIELIEDEVYDIEDAILNMHHIDDSSDDNDSDSESGFTDEEIFTLDRFSTRTSLTRSSKSSFVSSCDSSTTDSTFNANIIGWRKKGDMLRRIGECRKRVMSIVRLLGSKADVIKGFSKRCNEEWGAVPRSEIGMYLGDIQDHIITMVSSLNHYEKLLSRSHSNYLAQINIDMTKVNNDMNDVLGKITILGTVVLPMNVITGLWGMNVLVPGQTENSLQWFICIAMFMVIFAYIAYLYTKKRFGF